MHQENASVWFFSFLNGKYKGLLKSNLIFIEFHLLRQGKMLSVVKCHRRKMLPIVIKLIFCVLEDPLIDWIVIFKQENKSIMIGSWLRLVDINSLNVYISILGLLDGSEVQWFRVIPLWVC